MLSWNSRIVIGANFLWAAANIFPFIAVIYFQQQFGFGPTLAGLSIALTSISSIVGILMFNKLNTNRNPRQIFSFWAVVFAVSYFLAGLAYQNYLFVMILLMIGNFSLSNITLVSKTIIIAVTDLSNRKKTFAYNLSAMNIARIFMPSLAVLIYEHNSSNMMYLLMYNGLFVLLSGLLIKFKIGDLEQVTNSHEQVNHESKNKVSILIPTFVCIAMAVILMGQINFIIPQYTNQYISLKIFSLVIFTYSMFSALFAPTIARLTSGFDELYNIMSGLIFMALALIIMQANSPVVMVFVSILFSIGSIQLLTNIDTFYSKYLKGKELNNAMQINKLLVNSSKTIGPIVLGFVIETYNIHVAIYACGLIAIIGVIALAIQKQHLHSLKEISN